MSDSKTILLEEVIRLFNSLGVTPGIGADGKLMSRIIAEVEGSGVPVPVKIEIPRGFCPLCGARDLTLCDCDPVAQLEALKK
jgi:hypothetical protein